MAKPSNRRQTRQARRRSERSRQQPGHRVFTAVEIGLYAVTYGCGALLLTVVALCTVSVVWPELLGIRYTWR